MATPAVADFGRNEIITSSGSLTDGADRRQRADDQRRRDRQQELLYPLPLPEHRYGDRHRRRTQQEVDELRAGEELRVGNVGNGHH